FRVTGLSGTYPGIILLYTAFNLPFAVWMMKSFFDELSVDVEDAARLDGSSGFRVFWKICLPQVRAGLAATAVFGLILTWSEVVCLLGPSGCGKTTTLRMIAGLEAPTSGDVLIAGRRVNDLKTRDRNIAMVFQFYALYPTQTVAENLAYSLHADRLPPAELAK